MTPERMRQIDEIFHSACELTPAGRQAYLSQACGSDHELRREVELLLASDEKGGSLYEAPAYERAAPLISREQTRITPGMSISHYEILSRLGAGGMGEVWRARDKHLKRDVAIKLLPSEFAQDADRLRRFEREAQAASALNHPNILTIYEIGSFENTRFIVTELIEGQTLRRQIASGPMNLPEVLKIAVQVAGALAVAHDAGIIHRDIKPENIMVRSDGLVKVLDFGLAKLRPQQPTEGIEFEDTTKKVLTGSGVVMGTVGYMSPEQVRGQNIDHLSDIFSFGVLLYEMLSGQQPFQGESMAETMAAIANEEPPELSGGNGHVPGPLERIVKRCLEKQKERRFQSASDLGFALESLSTPSGVHPKTSQVTRRASRWPLLSNSLLAWGITTLAVLSLLATLSSDISYLTKTTTTNDQLTMFSVNLPTNTSLISLALSPDGSRVALTLKEGSGQVMLYLRQFDAENVQKLGGTKGASYPFWSPDSRSIGFFAGGRLKKIQISGGLPQILCEAGWTGGTWNRDGVIIFGTRTGGLFKTSVTDGERSPLTTSDQQNADFSHRWPLFLPDGRSFLYFSNGAIYLGSLDGIETRKLFQADANVIYVPPGYLLFQRLGTMMAQAFDPHKLITSGEPLPISEFLGTVSTHHSYQLISGSESGMLAYHKSDKSQLIWFNREGRRIGEVAFEGDYYRPSISPDGKRIAFEGFNPRTPGRDIWMMELSSGIPIRFTSHSGWDEGPVWSPDSSRIVFSSQRGSYYETFQKAVNSSGKSEILFNFGSDNAPNDWSMDGRFIAFWTLDPKTNSDIWILPLEGDRKPIPLLHSEFNEVEARFSPNGKWIASSSDESGRHEIYVQSFPDKNNRKRVSNSGGTNPVWRRDGRELFYLAADGNLMSVEVKSAGLFEVGKIIPLFQTKSPRVANQNFEKLYTVTPDGQRFLVRSREEQENPLAITVVVNWAAVLEKF